MRWAAPGLSSAFWQLCMSERRVAAVMCTALLMSAGQLVGLQPAVAQTDVPQIRASASNPRGIFSGLRVGQKVTFADKGGAYEISLLNDGSIGSHVVIEIGTEYLVLDDLVAVSRRWIPATSVRSVVWTRIRQVP